MVRVVRIATFVISLAVSLLFAATAFGQVPPGVPYEPGKHPSAVLTYITTRDFKATTYAAAQKAAGFEPLGLSEKEGKRTSIEIALPMPPSQKIQFLSDDYPEVKVEFYPVVRQTYALTGGGQLIIDAFRFPKVPIPMNVLTSVLNITAFQPGTRFWKARFGPAPTPDRLMVRGFAALLFDEYGTLDLFWREGNDCYMARTKSPRADLMRMIEDLL